MAEETGATTDTTAADTAAADTTKTADTGAATLLSDKGADKGGETQTAAPATWPDDWRQKLAGEDQKALKRLERFSDPAALWSSFRATENKVRSGEYKVALPENASAEELAAWRADNGIPETPEGYLEKLPNGIVVGEDDKKLVGLFVADMHAKNASPEIVHAAIGSYYRVMEEVQAEQAEADEQGKRESEDALHAEWGGDFRRNMSSIHGLLDTAPEGVKDRLLGARLADGTPLGNDANMLRFLASLAREVNPVATVVPGAGANAGQAIDDELAGIQKMMGDHNSDYWKGPKAEKLQARFRELVTARDKIKGRAA